MGFKTEITITSEDALTAIDFIAGYLNDYPDTDQRAALERVIEALGEADRIVIIPEHEEA